MSDTGSHSGRSSPPPTQFVVYKSRQSVFRFFFTPGLILLRGAVSSGLLQDASLLGLGAFVLLDDYNITNSLVLV